MKSQDCHEIHVLYKCMYTFDHNCKCVTSRSLSELFYTFVERTSVAESDAKLWKKSAALEPRCWRIPPLIGLSATYQNTSRYKEAGLQWRQLFWSCLAPSAAAKLKYFFLGYLLILEINLLNPTQCFFPKAYPVLWPKWQSRTKCLYRTFTLSFKSDLSLWHIIHHHDSYQQRGDKHQQNLGRVFISFNQLDFIFIQFPNILKLPVQPFKQFTKGLTWQPPHLQVTFLGTFSLSLYQPLHFSPVFDIFVWGCDL